MDMKKALILSLILLLSFSLFACGVKGDQPQQPGQKEEQQQQQPAGESNEADADSIIYKNTSYGFNFSLPQNWKGYTIVNSQWEGLATGDAQEAAIVETGPLISIRHPQWAADNPRQDIPIMVFTTSQWNSLQENEFHIGAAPIGPKELGSNAKYVFALPARYNYAFPTGYEEVEEILENNPLQPVEYP